MIAPIGFDETEEQYIARLEAEIARHAASQGSAGGEQSEVQSGVEKLIRDHIILNRFNENEDGTTVIDSGGLVLTLSEALRSAAPAQAQQVWPKEIRSLVNEIAGVWDAFEIGLRQEISNTNYAVVREKLSAVESLIASSVPSPSRETKA